MLISMAFPQLEKPPWHVHINTHTRMSLCFRFFSWSEQKVKIGHIKEDQLKLQTETAKGMKGREATITHKHDRPGCRWDPRSSPGCIYCTEGFPWHRETGWSRGWANQHEEKPVAKLQPTTCVISQICGDNQQHKFLTKVWTHSDHSHHILKWSESHSSSLDTNVSPGVTKRLHTPKHTTLSHIHPPATDSWGWWEGK